MGDLGAMTVGFVVPLLECGTACRGRRAVVICQNRGGSTGGRKDGKSRGGGGGGGQRSSFSRSGSRNDSRGGPRNDSRGGPRNDSRGGPRNDSRSGPRNDSRSEPRNDSRSGPRNDSRGGSRNDSQGGPRKSARGGQRGFVRGGQKPRNDKPGSTDGKADKENELVPCPNCNGTGYVKKRSRFNAPLNEIKLSTVLNTKWTAMESMDGKRQFICVGKRVKGNAEAELTSLFGGVTIFVPLSELRDSNKWRNGWKTQQEIEDSEKMLVCRACNGTGYKKSPDSKPQTVPRGGEGDAATGRSSTRPTRPNDRSQGPADRFGEVVKAGRERPARGVREGGRSDVRDSRDNFFGDFEPREKEKFRSGSEDKLKNGKKERYFADFDDLDEDDEFDGDDDFDDEFDDDDDSYDDNYEGREIDIFGDSMDDNVGGASSDGFLDAVGDADEEFSLLGQSAGGKADAGSSKGAPRAQASPSPGEYGRQRSGSTGPRQSKPRTRGPSRGNDEDEDLSAPRRGGGRARMSEEEEKELYLDEERLFFEEPWAKADDDYYDGIDEDDSPSRAPRGNKKKPRGRTPQLEPDSEGNDSFWL